MANHWLAHDDKHCCILLKCTENYLVNVQLAIFVVKTSHSITFPAISVTTSPVYFSRYRSKMAGLFTPQLSGVPQLADTLSVLNSTRARIASCKVRHAYNR